MAKKDAAKPAAKKGAAKPAAKKDAGTVEKIVVGPHGVFDHDANADAIRTALVQRGQSADVKIEHKSTKDLPDGSREISYTVGGE